MKKHFALGRKLRPLAWLGNGCVFIWVHIKSLFPPPDEMSEIWSSASTFLQRCVLGGCAVERSYERT